MKDIYKLELTSEEMSFLRFISMNSPNTPKGLVTKLLNAELYIPSYNKRLATRKATKVRSDRAKEKIQNAINLLHLENKAITHNSIAITSGVSYNTVKKYIPDLDKIGKLE